MIGDKELLALRSEYCSLISMLFLTEADAALMELMGGDARARARAAEEWSPQIAEGWFQLGDLCGGGGAADWAERCAAEYTAIFVGPGIPRLTPCESFYRSGRAYGVHLGYVRNFMERVGLEPAEGATEPEDHISSEFQILRYLIEKQGAAENEEGEAEWLALQGEFVRRHMSEWAPRFFQDAVNDDESKFFEAFSKIGMGYITWDLDLLEDWGPKLEDDELLHIQTDRPWAGPMFDADPPNPDLIEESPLLGEEDLEN